MKAIIASRALEEFSAMWVFSLESLLTLSFWFQPTSLKHSLNYGGLVGERGVRVQCSQLGGDFPECDFKPPPLHRRCAKKVLQLGKSGMSA